MEGKEVDRMKKNFRRPAGKGRAGKGFLLGLAAGVLLLSCAVSVISILCLNGSLRLEHASTAAKAAFGLAVFFGCFLTARSAQRGKLLRALLTALALALLVLGACCAVSEGGALSVGGLLGITAAGFLPGALLGVRRKRNSYV